MVRFLKKAITLAILSAIGYIGYKIFKIIKATIDLDKALPQYLENVYGEKPTISIQLTFNKITLTAGFSNKLLDKKEELEKAIWDYVKDFYPAICQKCLMVNIIEKDVEPQMEPEEKPEIKIDDKKSTEEKKGDGWSI